MKKSLLSLGIGIAMAVVSFTPLRVHAEGAPSGKMEKKETPRALTMAGKKAGVMHATGSVVRVEGENVEVKLPKETSTFMTDTGTKVMKGGKAVGMDEVKAGERVRVIYESAEGKMHAKEIHILPAKAKGHAGEHHKGAEKK